MANTIHMMLAHVSYLARYLQKCDLQCMIGVVLMDLNISSGIGYRYLKTAIRMFYDNDPLIMEVGLYEAVARQYGPFVTKDQVEVAIRRVVKPAWEKRDTEKWMCYFASDTAWMEEKPNNTEFISRICAFLELWEEMREKEIAEMGVKTASYEEA